MHQETHLSVKFNHGESMFPLDSLLLITSKDTGNGVQSVNRIYTKLDSTNQCHAK